MLNEHDRVGATSRTLGDMTQPNPGAVEAESSLSASGITVTRSSRPRARSKTEGVCQVVITAPDAAWLADFVRGLVEDRLCACGHITDIRAIYRWRGSTEDHPEAHVALHTRTVLVPAIVERTNRLHPYEVPCVAAVPIVAVNPAYRQWILDETNPVVEPNTRTEADSR